MLFVLLFVVGIFLILPNSLFARVGIQKPSYFSYIGILSIVISFITFAFSYSEPGKIYKVYFPFGGSKVVNTNGIYFNGFGRSVEYQQEIPIKFIFEDVASLSEGIYGYKAEQWEFSDAVKGSIAVSVIVNVNSRDTEKFGAMVDNTRSEDKLVQSRIIPNIRNSIKNSCKLMYAQDYISGEAASFDSYFKDQLENGSYMLEEIPYYDKKAKIIDTTKGGVTIETNSNTSSIKKFRIKRDKLGEPIREKTNSLMNYNLEVAQAIVTSIDWEDKFDQRLDAQKNEVAQTQLEKQKAEKAIYTKKRIIEEGESAKSEERAKLEKEQIQKTITAQTAAEVAKFKQLEEANLLEASKKSSERTKIEADALAYKNQKMVASGMTPQEKAEWDYKTKVGVAEQQSKTNYPETLIICGNGTNNNGLLETLIGADVVKQMRNKNKE